MARSSVDVLAEDLELAREFDCATSAIVDVFEDFGPQVVGTGNGAHDLTTPISTRQSARGGIIDLL